MVASFSHHSSAMDGYILHRICRRQTYHCTQIAESNVAIWKLVQELK